MTVFSLLQVQLKTCSILKHITLQNVLGYHKNKFKIYDSNILNREQKPLCRKPLLVTEATSVQEPIDQASGLE